MSGTRKELHSRYCPDACCYSNGIDSPGAECRAFDATLDRFAVESGRASGLQKDVAFRIRAELVCCDIYEKVRQDALRIDQSRKPVDSEEVTPGTPSGFGLQGAIGGAIVRKEWHDLCYWGEAAARIAEGRCPGYEAQPNICRCGCLGCEHNCSAHLKGAEERTDG